MRKLLFILCTLVLVTEAQAFMFRITWDPVPGVIGYHVYRSDHGKPYESLAVVSDIVYADPMIVEGTLYSYAVTSVGPGGMESFFSEPLAVYTGFVGDVTGDGVFDLRDLTVLANYLAGNGPSEIHCFRCGDMDNNYILNSVDMSLMEAGGNW